MEFSKEEIQEMLLLYWKNLSRKVRPRSFENGIWKKIEAKLLGKLKDKNETKH